MPEPLRVILVGHACGPNLGSEPGLTWNLASRLATRGHQVWLITHPQRRESIDAELARVLRPTLHVEYTNLDPAADPWKDWSGEQGLKSHYLKWQHVAAARAKELTAAHAARVVHHISWGTINAPPLLHDLGVPVVWGPLGGGEAMPLSLRGYFGGWGAVAKEVVRHLQRRGIAWLPQLGRMAKRSAAVLACNRETAAVLKRAGARHVELLIDCAADVPADFALPTRPPGPLRLLWAGRLEPRKGLLLGLEAFARCRADVRLSVAGDGPQLDAAKALVAARGLADRVNFLGKLPYDAMQRAFDDADAFLFTSLRDRFGTIVLEAMSHGLPVIGLDHNGFGALVPPDSCVKVPVAGDVAGELAAAVDTLAGDHAARVQRAASALAFARSQHWDAFVDRIEAIYRDAVR
jgi:glycosyltransferase involved in cell wall biosynthesis